MIKKKKLKQLAEIKSNQFSSCHTDLACFEELPCEKTTDSQTAQYS